MITDQYLVSRNVQQDDDRNNLELFKNLLQPHFLFNSLNNLYALSLRKSEETPEAIAMLSHLLERVVSYSRQETILLSEEIALIQEYIALEKIWLGKCSFVMDFQVKGDTNDVSIPPLTIYTLIENAFKHGVSVRKSCSIIIKMTSHEKTVLFTIENDNFPKKIADKSGSGIGLQNLGKRLELLYPNKNTYKTLVKDNRFVVNLEIETT